MFWLNSPENHKQALSQTTNEKVNGVNKKLFNLGDGGITLMFGVDVKSTCTFNSFFLVFIVQSSLKNLLQYIFGNK